MSLDAFEKAAREADEGIPGFLGRIQALVESGKLRTFVAVYEEAEADGGYSISYWTAREGSYLSDLGAASYLQDALLNAKTEVDDDD